MRTSFLEGSVSNRVPAHPCIFQISCFFGRIRVRPGVCSPTLSSPQTASPLSFQEVNRRSWLCFGRILSDRDVWLTPLSGTIFLCPGGLAFLEGSESNRVFAHPLFQVRRLQHLFHQLSLLCFGRILSDRDVWLTPLSGTVFLCPRGLAFLEGSESDRVFAHPLFIVRRLQHPFHQLSSLCFGRILSDRDVWLTPLSGTIFLCPGGLGFFEGSHPTLLKSADSGL